MPTHHNAHSTDFGGTPWLLIDEAAEYLRCSTRTLRELVSNDRIMYKRLNPEKEGKLLFATDWLDAYIMGYGKDLILYYADEFVQHNKAKTMTQVKK